MTTDPQAVPFNAFQPQEVAALRAALRRRGWRTRDFSRFTGEVRLTPGVRRTLGNLAECLAGRRPRITRRKPASISCHAMPDRGMTLWVEGRPVGRWGDPEGANWDALADKPGALSWPR